MKETFSEIELRKLDLNLLLVFSAVMRERSIGRAAARLYLGASAVSMALSRLRETMADPLFVRAGLRMEPTARALALWADIEPALSGIEAALRRSRHFDPGRAERIIRLAAPDDMEFVLVPRLLARLAGEAPGVRLVVRPSDFRTLLDRLDSGDADVAVSATPTQGIERRHVVRPLHREQFSVLFDAGQLGITSPIDLATYLATPHAMVSIAGDMSGPIDQALAALGHARRILATVAHFPTLPFVLRATRCLAHFPAMAGRHYARAYGLEISPLPIATPEFEVAMIWHVRASGDPAQVWFRDVLAEEIAGLA